MKEPRKIHEKKYGTDWKEPNIIHERKWGIDGKNEHIIKNKLEKREGRIPNKETIKEIPVVCRDKEISRL